MATNATGIAPSATGTPEDNRRVARARNVVIFSGGTSLLGAALLGFVSWPVALTISAVTFGLIALANAPLFQNSTDEQQPEVSSDMLRLLRYSAILDALPQPVLVLDGKDRIELSNAAGTALFGNAIENAHISTIVRAPTALEVLREARHAGEAREAEYSSVTSQGFSGLFYAAPLAGTDDPSSDEMIVMIRDRTEQKKLEKMRTDFIANVSHELRTPLASILGFIETLQGHAKDDPAAQERFFRLMQAQTERMLRLVQDLVSLSALELNERRVPEEKVDLCEVASVVRETMAPVAKAAHGEMVQGPTDCTAEITGDRDQLIQVIQNLSDNALRYGRNSGDEPARVHVSVGFGSELAFENAEKSGDSPDQIAVRAGCQTEDLRYVRVRDEGPGIEKNDLPRLTERFYRIDVERSRATGGTGLGLAIVKHIVGRHRGGILIESAPGRGAAFTCYFPPDVADDLDTSVPQV
ncbi:MAG: ATP-binding protein [Pseudomonadota bacterium]